MSNLGPTYDLKERTLSFAAECVRVCMEMGPGYAQEHIGKQLMRSSTSAMANYAEASAAESRNDLIHKQSLARKELQESEVWLLLIQKLHFVKPPSRISPLVDECQQLCKIFNKASQTLRKRTVSP